jgi:hypothetical protein
MLINSIDRILVRLICTAGFRSRYETGCTMRLALALLMGLVAAAPPSAPAEPVQSLAEYARRLKDPDL